MSTNNSLTPLELKVYKLWWMGKNKTQIGKEVGRVRQSVTRILDRISQKIKPLDPNMIRDRLESELLNKIPNMTVSQLINALTLYTPKEFIQKTTGKVDVNVKSDVTEILKEYAEFFRTGDAVKILTKDRNKQPVHKD